MWIIFARAFRFRFRCFDTENKNRRTGIIFLYTGFICVLTLEGF